MRVRQNDIYYTTYTFQTSDLSIFPITTGMIRYNGSCLMKNTPFRKQVMYIKKSIDNKGMTQ